MSGLTNLQPSLRYRIQGAWELESYTATPTDTTGPPATRRPFFPMTKHVTGIILYTNVRSPPQRLNSFSALMSNSYMQDGYMSAQMSIPGQSPFSPDDQTGWAERYTCAFPPPISFPSNALTLPILKPPSAKRYYAYSGPFYVTSEPGRPKETLRHMMQLCLSPNEVGKVQLRDWKIEYEEEEMMGSGKRRVLVLGTEEPVLRRGKMCHLELRWRKLGDNSHGKPPAEAYCNGEST